MFLSFLTIYPIKSGDPQSRRQLNITLFSQCIDPMRHSPVRTYKWQVSHRFQGLGSVGLFRYYYYRRMLFTFYEILILPLIIKKEQLILATIKNK